MRTARTLLLGAALAAVLGVLPAAAGPAPTAAGPSAAVTLVSQTPVAVPGQAFVADLHLDGVPPDGSIRVELHQRIRSRSELALSMEDEALRGRILDTVKPVADLAARPGGVRRVAIPLAPAPGGLVLPTEGVYPLALTARGAGGDVLGRVVTHLIVPPEAGDDAPDLAVAVVAELGAPVALQPDETVDLDTDAVTSMAAIAEGIAAEPEVPATLDVQAETVEALQASDAPEHAALLEVLRTAATDRLVLDDTYVPLDLDALVEAELGSELGPQLTRSRAVLESALGSAPDQRVRVAPPSLGAAGLRTLAFIGTTRLLLDDADVQPLPDGIISYSLAQPFVVAVPDDDDSDDQTPGDVLALAPDPVVVERLTMEGSPGLVVSRVLAELALLRLEQPSVARTAVLPLRGDVAAETVQRLLAALGTGRPFDAVTLPDAFEHAAPVLDGGGNPAERALQPADRDDLGGAVADDVASGRAAVTTFRSLVGGASPLPDAAGRHLLVAVADGLSDDERSAHVGAAGTAIGRVTGGVSTPATFTLTLTARDGTIPLTVRNDTGIPLRVSVRLRSPKLEFPDGDTIPLTLREETTRLDIRVRSRASGAFPLIIDVRTPDGLRTLSTSRYTVRSTAVSGAGLVLSIGAGLFLVVWWARHWRRTRRSKRLIAADAHPSAT